MKKSLLLLTGLLLFFLNTNAQYVFTKLWDKTLGGTFEENPYASGANVRTHKCYVTPVGNILVAGTSNSFISGDKTQSTWGDYDAWIVALDSSTGQILWDRDYGGISREYFEDLTPIGNGSHLLLFSTLSSQVGGNFTAPCLYSNCGSLRYLLIDSNWNVIADRIVAATGSFEARRAIWQNGQYYLLFHGAYAQSDLVDTTCYVTSSDTKTMIVARDSSGNWIWDKLYGADGILTGEMAVDRSTDLMPLAGGGFLMSGQTTAHFPHCTITDTSAGGNDINIYRLDSVGKVVWQRCFGGSGYDRVISDLLKTTDGNYVFSGISQSPQGGELSQPNPSTGVPTFWNVKFDDLGAILWDKRYSPCHGIWHVVSACINTSDGGFLIGGTVNASLANLDSVPGCDVTEYGRGKEDYWLVKLDNNGNKQWDKRWGGSGRDRLYGLAQLEDDSYIASGISYSNISGDKTENNRDASLATADYWVVRFRADEIVGLDEAAAVNMHLTIYPNPAKDICTIILSNTSTLQHSNTLTLYDITGRTLLQQVFTGKAIVDISKLAKGVYIAEVKNEDGRRLIGKVLKE